MASPHLPSSVLLGQVRQRRWQLGVILQSWLAQEEQDEPRFHGCEWTLAC